ncbi:hypothetical protein AM493_13705 [Flavobacterium akiainvivens]|uniref:Endonuclease GajA/Old nuclease/RecF-like AAA domain-containing protein n=2 Tax=Flavobacterium akiainvivens TaxID=1202724 RepID=A0A0M9VIT2_9FLAO|nr:hypothetical protein AM493_13705 [Flavobacterium akiainvivens]
MSERLVIKNFGPIKSVELDLGKMTILIGEQATGKSTIAKVLAVCRYFSYIVNYSVSVDKQNQFANNEQFSDGLRDWEMDSYLSENSSFYYENPLYIFEFKSKKVVENENVGDGLDYRKEFFELHTKITSESEEFDRLLSELDDLRIEETLQKKTAVEFFQMLGWTPNENFYRLNVKKIMDNPLYIPTERVLQSLSFSNSLLTSEALQHELSKLNRIVRGYNIEIAIEPLSLVYKNQNGLGYAKKESNSEYYLVHNGSSGYQSTIPIVLAQKFYAKRKRTFIIEEPEMNLFPKVQKKLMEFFVENIYNNKHSFLLPTHSPYVLSSLNNLVYAYTIGHLDNDAFKGQVKEIIPEKYWLNPNDIAVYYLGDGEAKDIFDREENLINTDYIDSVSEIISDEFDRLLSIEVSYNNTAQDD